MSRFFAAGDSSSESSSSEEEELYSDDGGERQPGGQHESSGEESEEDEGEDESSSEEGGPVGVSRFLRDAASSEDESSDSDTPKVVKSAKSKRLEELEGVIKLIDNAVKINDWSSISNEFDKLNRQVTKVASADNRPPKPFVKTIADLEDFMNEAIARQKVTPKKMNATNAKGLNAMKQKIKKTNKEYATEVEKYREDKADYMMSDEEEEPQPAQRRQRAAVPAAEEGAVDDQEGFSTVGQGGRTLRYTSESILSHLRTINESRGKKNTDRASQIQVMERLLNVATSPYQKIRVLLTLVSTRFDLTSSSTSSYMSQEQWKLADSELGLLLETLEQNGDIAVVENAEAWEDDEKLPQIQPGKKLQVPGSVASMLERLDDELTRSLQHTDPHAAEYIDRLSDEQNLYNRILRTQLYVEDIRSDDSLAVSQDNLSRVMMRRVEHLYFKVRFPMETGETFC